MSGIISVRYFFFNRNIVEETYRVLVLYFASHAYHHYITCHLLSVSNVYIIVCMCFGRNVNNVCPVSSCMSNVFIYVSSSLGICAYMHVVCFCVCSPVLSLYSCHVFFCPLLCNGLSTQFCT